ncbi:unannotated protein [freshwater metagenome]|uniref:Unannotated protein n=1 Tax=freshwater metagenome TaxID=449393 RepID=A0A6J7NRH1_9ZZZZ
MNAGKFLGGEFGQLKLVPRVDDRPQQRDRHGLYVAFAQYCERAAGVVIAELLEHGAMGVDALVDPHDVAPGQQHRGLLPVDRLGAEPFLDADDLVAARDGHGALEAGGGDEPNAGPVAGEQRVDADRGGVREEIGTPQRVVER